MDLWRLKWRRTYRVLADQQLHTYLPDWRRLPDSLKAQLEGDLDQVILEHATAELKMTIQELPAQTVRMLRTVRVDAEQVRESDLDYWDSPLFSRGAIQIVWSALSRYLMRIIQIFDPRPFNDFHLRGTPLDEEILPRLMRLTEITGVLEWRVLAQQLDIVYVHARRFDRDYRLAHAPGAGLSIFRLPKRRERSDLLALHAKFRILAAAEASRLTGLSAAAIPDGATFNDHPLLAEVPDEPNRREPIPGEGNALRVVNNILASGWPLIIAIYFGNQNVIAGLSILAIQLLSFYVVQRIIRHRLNSTVWRERSISHDRSHGTAINAADLRRISESIAVRYGSLEWFLDAPPGAKALLYAAMDARRFGCGEELPLPLLESAAPGYLRRIQDDPVVDDGIEDSLAYLAQADDGGPGLLTEVSLGSSADGEQHYGADTDQSTLLGTTCAYPLYRLAHDMDAFGYGGGEVDLPPSSFWIAVATYALPQDLPALATSAQDLGYYRYAAALRKKAAQTGIPGQAAQLIRDLHARHIPVDQAATWAVAHVIPDTAQTAELVSAMLQCEASEQAASIARRAASESALINPLGTARLIDAVAAAAPESIPVLLNRGPAEQTSLSDLPGVAALLRSLRDARAEQQTVLLARRAASVPVDDTHGAAVLIRALADPPTHKQAKSLARRAALGAPLGDAFGVATLIEAIDAAEPDVLPLILIRDPANHAAVEPAGVSVLLRVLTRIPTRPERKTRASARRQITMLVKRATGSSSVTEPRDTAALLDALGQVDAAAERAGLADRAAQGATLKDPSSVAQLLVALIQANATGSITTLLERDPAGCVAIEDAASIARLLRALQSVPDGQQQAAKLAARTSSQLPFRHTRIPHGLADALRAMHAHADISTLQSKGFYFDVSELTDAGLRLKSIDDGLGWEITGGPSLKWHWKDL
ncbi:hypothetical protein AB0K48_02325 [Nonomuraea sp. NPDC055795]